jgi:hypothetical protein
MFVIVHNNYVILGPKNWNKLNFEEVLLEECEVTYTLDTRNDNKNPIIINENTKILPVVGLPQPYFNSKIQRLDGPYWNLSNTEAQMYFIPGDLPVDSVKNSIKEIVANNRYVKENSGIKLEIQNTLVSIDTARGSREIFFDTWLAMTEEETINWKFPETWMSVTKSDMFTIVSAGKTHIQTCFNWEQSKVIEIDNATTLQELHAINLEVNF